MAYQFIKIKDNEEFPLDKVNKLAVDGYKFIFPICKDNHLTLIASNKQLTYLEAQRHFKEAQKISEQLVFKLPLTYHDNVMNHIKKMIPQRLGVTNKSADSLYQIQDDIDKIFWKNYQDIKQLISQYELRGKNPEDAGEEIHNQYYKDYTLEEKTLPFGSEFTINAQKEYFSGRPPIDWKITTNSSIKYLNYDTKVINPGPLGQVDEHIYHFKVIGTETGLIKMVYIDSDGKIWKTRIYKIFVNTNSIQEQAQQQYTNIKQSNFGKKELDILDAAIKSKGIFTSGVKKYLGNNTLGWWIRIYGIDKSTDIGSIRPIKGKVGQASSIMFKVDEFQITPETITNVDDNSGSIDNVQSTFVLPLNQVLHKVIELNMAASHKIQGFSIRHNNMNY